jgi:putative acetyltransferase
LPDEAGGGAVEIAELAMRQADSSDVVAIAAAHRDSILTLGPAFYPPDAVAAWHEAVHSDMYLRAMNRGEVFFIATGIVDGEAIVLGFSSDYRIEGTTFGVSVYVRGSAARRQIGSRLLQLAEAHARAQGATDVAIEASLAGVAFYRVHRYVEIDAGRAALESGRAIECVLMRKDLT